MMFPLSFLLMGYVVIIGSRSPILSGLTCSIMISCPYNVYPLTPNFYIVKLGLTGVFNFSYFCSKTYIVGTR